MSQALKPPMTTAEFLDWEEQQEGKYEFDRRGTITAMTGGSRAHAAISRNVMVALHIRLRGGPCEAYGSDLKVEVAGAIRYPDAFVVCSTIANEARLTDRPVVVFEVLSPSTATIDFTEKHDEYRDTPSVQRYVILRQDRMHATIHRRVGEAWVREQVADAGTLDLPEIDVLLTLSELYEGVLFGVP